MLCAQATRVTHSKRQNHVDCSAPIRMKQFSRKFHKPQTIANNNILHNEKRLCK